MGQGKENDGPLIQDADTRREAIVDRTSLDTLIYQLITKKSNECAEYSCKSPLRLPWSSRLGSGSGFDVSVDLKQVSGVVLRFNVHQTTKVG